MVENLKVSIKNLDVHYGDKQALFNVNLNIMEKEVTSLIGPSGCGKSTLLKCINRMNDLVEICNRLQTENKSLKEKQETLSHERASMVQKNEQVRARVEAMIVRLKSMEQG